MIEIRKGPPSDEMMLRILSQWFEVAQPKWKKPMDMVVLVAFLCLTIFFSRQDPVPFYTWIALGGVVFSLAISFGYVRLLSKMALASNKQSPAYYLEKHYRFYPDHFEYSYQGGGTVEAPLHSFTSLALTKDALIFMVGKKLALWIVRTDLTTEERYTLLEYVRANGVKVVISA